MTGLSLLPRPFALDVEDHGTTRIISLAEEIDIAAVPRLRAAMHCALSDSARETLVIDLSAATFIETMGMKALYNAHLRSEQVGIKLVLIPGPPQVQRALALCPLGELLPFAAEADVTAQAASA